jgi:hypothetical protein
VLVLFILSRLIYFDHLAGGVREIITNIALILVAFIAIGWRMAMDWLSDMRYPYTVTKRIMFIVITTVLLHFIFYLWLPSFYLNLYHDFRGTILNLVSNQAVTTVVIQIILVYFDLFFCCWNSSKKKIEDEDKPYACQKLLHQKMEYPPFPFSFKMIVLYKFWSLITFFAFHIPMVLVFILLALVFLYVKDKFNIYFHYKAEIINCRVQFKFLKIYTNFFTIYMYLIFVHTQRTTIEIVVGAIVTILTVIAQLLFFRYHKKALEDDEELSVQMLNELNPTCTSHYKEKYLSFIESIRSESLDREIENYILSYSLLDSQMEEEILKAEGDSKQ